MRGERIAGTDVGDALDFNLRKILPFTIGLSRTHPPVAPIAAGTPVAIYVRHSCKSMRARQAQLLRRYARSQGFQIVGSYSDADAGRASLIELMKCAASGLIAAVVVESIDRLYRDSAALLELALKLGKNFVRIQTPEDAVRQTRRGKRPRHKSARAADRKSKQSGQREGTGKLPCVNTIVRKAITTRSGAPASASRKRRFTSETS